MQPVAVPGPPIIQIQEKIVPVPVIIIKEVDVSSYLLEKFHHFYEQKINILSSKLTAN